MPKPPTVASFPPALQPVIHQPTIGSPDNIIVFFTGLGDTSSNFSSFAKALNLPDSLTVTLQGPYPLPFPIGPGFQWSDDVQVNTTTGTFDDDSPVRTATELVADTISKLISDHGYSPSQIHLFGFGQGGSLALSIPLHKDLSRGPSLGGVVSIGGTLPISANDTSSAKNRTPIMLLGGSQGLLARDDGSAVKRVKSVYEFVEYNQWKKSNDGLPGSREEALPMMHFLARRLKSRRGVPDGAVEV
jgi:predicted esterase